MRRQLTERGFAHSERTADTAAALALIHGEDPDLARSAGLVHDAARDFSDEELLARAESLNLDICPAERRRPYLLHAAIGSRLLKDLTGESDPRVASAVEKHTFGALGMTNLDKIVYLADMIEPRRDFTGVDEIRALAERDLDKAFAAGFKRQLIELIERDRVLHPRSLEVWNKIVTEVTARGE